MSMQAIKGDLMNTEITKGKVQVGDKAPDFTLPSSKGEQVRLSDFLGKKHVVLYFYPKGD